MKLARNYASLFIALQLAGCQAGTPVKPAATPAEQVWQLSVRAQKTADAAEAALTAGLNQGLVTSAQAKQIHPSIDTLRAAYRAARVTLLQDGNPSSAITILRGADAALEILQGFLAGQGKPVPKLQPAANDDNYMEVKHAQS